MIDLTSRMFEVINLCPTFSGSDMIAIMSDVLVERLKQLSRRDIDLAAGETLFHHGDRVTTLYLVTDGAVRLERSTPGGARLILQRAVAGDILAEASCFAQRYHCDGVAAVPSHLLSVPLKAFMETGAADPALQTAFAAHLARRVQETRARAEILSLKTVAARLDAWLSLTESTLPEKGRWRELAESLAVTPEALYREIARRR